MKWMNIAERCGAKWNHGMQAWIFPGLSPAGFLGAVLEQAAQIAEQQPNYPDTHTGMRQQWVKDQIAAKIRALRG